MRERLDGRREIDLQTQMLLVGEGRRVVIGRFGAAAHVSQQPVALAPHNAKTQAEYEATVRGAAMR